MTDEDIIHFVNQASWHSFALMRNQRKPTIICGLYTRGNRVVYLLTLESKPATDDDPVYERLRQKAIEMGAEAVSLAGLGARADMSEALLVGVHVRNDDGGMMWVNARMRVERDASGSILLGDMERGEIVPVEEPYTGFARVL